MGKQNSKIRRKTAFLARCFEHLDGGEKERLRDLAQSLLDIQERAAERIRGDKEKPGRANEAEGPAENPAAPCGKEQVSIRNRKTAKEL
jgi:hypothetical protein